MILTGYPPMALLDDGKTVCPDGQAGMTVLPEFVLSEAKAREGNVAAERLNAIMRDSARQHQLVVRRRPPRRLPRPRPVRGLRRCALDHGRRAAPAAQGQRRVGALQPVGVARLCAAPALVPHAQRRLHDRQFPRRGVADAEGAEDAEATPGSSCCWPASTRAPSIPPPKARRPSPTPSWSRRARVLAKYESRAPRRQARRPGLRRRRGSLRRWVALAPLSIDSALLARESVLTLCRLRGHRLLARPDVQLQEMPGLLLLLSADRPQQARRGAACQAFRPHLPRGQGQVHGRALGPQVLHAPQEGRDLRRRVPLLRHREALLHHLRGASRRCAAASPAAAAATTTSSPSSEFLAANTSELRNWDTSAGGRQVGLSASHLSMRAAGSILCSSHSSVRPTIGMMMSV